MEKSSGKNESQRAATSLAAVSLLESAPQTISVSGVLFFRPHRFASPQQVDKASEGRYCRTPRPLAIPLTPPSDWRECADIARPVSATAHRGRPARLA